MAQSFPDAFDASLINLVDVMAQTLGAGDKYGQANPDLLVLATNVNARVCLGKGRTKESEAEKKIAINWRSVYMRPWFADPAPDGSLLPNHIIGGTTYNTQPLTTHHWLRFQGQRLDIKQIDDPSGLGHHWEIYCQLVIP